MRSNPWLIAVLLLISPSLYAHTGSEIDHSLLSGLTHPITGLDHLLVLIGIGICSAKLASKSLFTLPILFLLAMASGALINFSAIKLPWVEPLILISVIAVGALASINYRWFFRIALASVSFFGIFHGYAHAAEMTNNTNLLLYFAGILLISLVICLISCAITLCFRKRFSVFYRASVNDL
ncbi:MAG: HupE/UreJ family protein [Methylococcaceae bacterium]